MRQLNRLMSRVYSSSPPSSLLNWNEFFRLRRRLVWFRRLAGGVPTTCAFLAAEGAILSMPVFDPTQPILGLDPLVIVGLGTAVGMATSFIAGSAMIGCVWRFFRPRLAAALNARQRDFYHRITQFRANVPPNPTQMNFSFDYYGEKIVSVADYRTWLRRQRQMLKERRFNL